MNKLTQNLIIGGAVVLVLGGIGGLVYYQRTKGGFSGEEVGESVVNYINENIPNTVASLTGVIEESGLFKVGLDLNGNQIDVYVSKDGKLLFPQVVRLTKEPEAPPDDSNGVTKADETVGGFSVSGDAACLEDGKPIVYFFGSDGCSHCQWEHPVFEQVAAEFGDSIVVKDNMNTDGDRDVFERYSGGGVPTIVLGCRYYRTGSGEGVGEEEEAKFLTALICKLTKNTSGDNCYPVSDLYEQIPE